MDPISNTLSSLNSLHAAYGAFSKAIHADHPALTLAKRLHISASTYQRYLGSFLKRSDEVKRDAKLVAFLHEDRALIAEVVLLFETVTRRVGLINLLIPKLDILRNCERVMYERVEFFQLMPVNQDDVECIRAVIADAEGRLMWYRFVGCKNRVANVKQLVEGISSFMSETFGFPRLRHANYLLDAVCVKSEESEVTATEFGRALRRFGPMKDFYIKAAAVVGPDGTPMPWFKKDYSKNEAESCLGKGRNPCCALRYAIGHDFWLSIADNLGRVQHLLINNSSSGYTVADELIKGLTSYSTLEACVDACLRLPGIALSPEQRQLDWSHMEAWLAEIFESSSATDHPRYPAAFGMQASPKSDSLSPTRGQDFDEVSPVFPRSNAQKKFFALPPPPRKNSEKSEKSDHEVEEPSPKARGSAVAAMHVQNALQVLENSEGVSSTIVGMLKLCAAELGTKAEAEAEAAEAEAAEAAEPAEANDA